MYPDWRFWNTPFVKSNDFKLPPISPPIFILTFVIKSSTCSSSKFKELLRSRCGIKKLQLYKFKKVKFSNNGKKSLLIAMRSKKRSLIILSFGIVISKNEIKLKSWNKSIICNFSKLRLVVKSRLNDDPNFEPISHIWILLKLTHPFTLK